MSQPTISAPPTAPGQQTAPAAYSIPSAYAGLFPPSVHWDERLRGVRRMEMGPPTTFEEEVARLEPIIKEYERQHGMESAVALKRVSKGEIEETEELVKWMFSYHDYRELKRKLRTPTVGIRGIPTKPSTKPEWRTTTS